MSDIDFSCRVCGKQCDSAPPLPERAVCEDCCEEHDYEYEPSERTHLCKHCCKPVDLDWYRCDDDVN